MKWQLSPTNGQKSYYGKAIVELNTQNETVLYSYGTKICAFVPGKRNNTVFVKYWNGYSATTMKHINSFCAQNGHHGYNKKDWEAL